MIVSVLVEDPSPDNQSNEKIEIFSTEDGKLKFLGDLLSNESSRAIFQLLTSQEMSANELSEKLDLRLSLVIHHVNKMIQIGIVQIIRVEKNSKNHDVKYYSAKPGIVILPNGAAEKAKKSKMFSNSFKTIFRFTSIGIAGVISWFASNAFLNGEFGEELPTHSGVTPFESIHYDILIPIIVTISVLSAGIIIERVYAKLKK